MRTSLSAILAMTLLVSHHANVAHGQLNQAQQEELLGEVIGIGIAGAVIGAAINEQNHHYNNGWNNNGWNNNGWNNNGWNNNGWNNNGWNNNNRWTNNDDWDDDDWNDNTNNRWNNNNNRWNNNGRRYVHVPSQGSRPQQSPVYRETYPAQPQRVYTQQPIYSSSIEGERVISSGAVISGERVISSGPVITGERVISSRPVGSVDQSVGAPAVKENSLPYKGPGVKIILEEETGGEVTYMVDGVEESTIQAGNEQTLTKKGKYEIRFSRGRTAEGKDLGVARYTISEGTYSFEVTDKGWELLRHKDVHPNSAVASSPSGIKTNAIPSKAAVTAAGGGDRSVPRASGQPVTPASDEAR